MLFRGSGYGVQRYGPVESGQAAVVSDSQRKKVEICQLLRTVNAVAVDGLLV